MIMMMIINDNFYIVMRLEDDLWTFTDGTIHAVILTYVQHTYCALRRTSDALSFLFFLAGNVPDVLFACAANNA